MKDFDFILASASPRRRDLAQRAGYKFRVEVSNVDESLYSDSDPVMHANGLAAAKANDVAEKFPNDLVLGADTIAACQGEIIGKPENARDAERITRMLFSQPHKVITAVAFVRLSDNFELVRADTTTVFPRKMSEQQILEHIKGGSWRGKAGGYAIQETGDEMVERIEGSLTNVMGLPMELVERILEEINR